MKKAYIPPEFNLMNFCFEKVLEEDNNGYYNYITASSDEDRETYGNEYEYDLGG